MKNSKKTRLRPDSDEAWRLAKRERDLQERLGHQKVWALRYAGYPGQAWVGWGPTGSGAQVSIYCVTDE